MNRRHCPEFCGTDVVASRRITGRMTPYIGGRPSSVDARKPLQYIEQRNRRRMTPPVIAQWSSCYAASMASTIFRTVFISLPAAATDRLRTNLLALLGPAALWIKSRSAWVRRKAKTTSSSFGAFSFLGALAGAFAEAFLAVFFLAMSITSCASPMLALTQGRCSEGESRQ